MSYKDKEGQAQLCIVDLAHPSVHVDLSHWQAVGMQGPKQPKCILTILYYSYRTAKLLFGASGFWHGAAGVAACWYGAAVRLVSFYIKVAPLTQTHLKMYLGSWLNSSL